MIIVGIDPGVATGFAVWDSIARKLTRVESLAIHNALWEVEQIHRAFGRIVPVIFEDARQRTWFGHARDLNQQKYGAGVREGVGSVKRDAGIWEDFLEDNGVPYIARKPSSGATKWKADVFARTTGWTARTNEHGRDAALLVYGFTLQDVQAAYRSWEQRRANQATHAQARR